MLDAETKGRIDSARDILVGKVPDPKSQVEQITIALIYKFMDDMDRRSEELGGKTAFFTGDFQKYRWANLLDKRLGGHERLILYAEGIEKMNVNKNIPQLFRDIFKGVFLPYRDPETLNLFLKEINGFSYDHSERLGDAYEYLLSVLGTQGDAGQFRTPRHIIDFIVAVVDPQKHETVLDPACGTAGFLISAFKHILKGNENLTPDERARLMTNFRGYDIAPDMVRLSRVNMYLHRFPNPVIHEYDTLTSEERWDERCDVIMANPPFMTPKGGIRPHNRFSIKAKRSEVLFVDYIAEHLNPGGRAGVIVPEGIIFQSKNAYKSLRKTLVENYLWAVVSLPAGVFNPYSGVKTSILFLDRNLAKRIDEVLFVKVKNDGFDLGAQRRPIEGSDLPEALKILDDYKKVQKAQEGKMALTVSRKRLLESPDVNLSGDRYRETAAVQSKWPMVRLGEVCELYQPQTITSKDILQSGPYKVFGANGIIGFYDKYNHEESEIAVTCRGATCGTVNMTEPRSWITGNAMVVHPKDERTLKDYLYFVLKYSDLSSTISGTGQPQITRQSLAPLEIPLPPLDIQRQIVAELDGYRKVIEAARQILAHYKPSLRIDPKWPMVTVGDVLQDVKYTPKVQKSEFLERGKYPIVDQSENFIAGYWNDASAVFHLSKPVVLFGDHTRALKYVDFDFVLGADGVKILQPDDRCVPRFFHLALLNADIPELGYSRHFKELVRVSIPIPPLEAQRQIVAEIEAERALVEANRKLVEIFEKKIQDKLAEIWGKE
jgi:type I restriction enzyme M protein